MPLSRLSTTIVGKSDGYKYGHWRQYPPGTRFVESYFEARAGAAHGHIIPFGLQYYLMEYLEGTRLTREAVHKMHRRANKALGVDVFNWEGWHHLLDKHNGILPIRIRAIPEGTPVPPLTPLFVVENTDYQFPWLTNFVETLLVKTWYPTTVASAQYAKYRMFLDFLVKNGTPSLIDHKWVDFGYRGVSSEESAALGGAAHLLAFRSSETAVADEFIEAYYGGQECQSAGIPAAEHSTITAWEREREEDAYRNMLRQYPTGLVSVVSDSYDYGNAVRHIWGERLVAEVLTRDGTVVIRPDSGDPPTTVLNTCQWLARNFGCDINEKGYKVLDRHVRIIQGDGIGYDSAYRILDTLDREGWSADNVTLGEGAGALQKVDRDTEDMAMKCCAVNVHGTWRDVHKDPVTGHSKVSKGGHLAVVNEGGTVKTVRKPDTGPHPGDMLVPVFENGKILRTYGFEEIRSRVHALDNIQLGG